MKQIVVIGCGRFGMSLSTTLEKLGNEVMVIDKDEEVINSIANKVTHAIVCDVTVEGSLNELGLSNFDLCVVAIGSDYKASIVATVEAKEIGADVQKDGTVTVKGSDGKMKVLPKTGETENIALSVLGSLMVLGSAFIFKKRI